MIPSGFPDLAGAPGRSQPPDPRQAQLQQAAEKLEAQFIALMLKESGVGKMPEGFGGGAGEEAFSGFLLEAYAEKISEKGGFGLAESIFQSLLERAD